MMIMGATGVLPTAVRLRGEVEREAVAQERADHPRVRGPDPMHWRHVQAQPVPAGVEDGLRGAHHRHLHAHALLQRRRRHPRRFRLLAPHRLLPGGDVHRAEEDTAMVEPVGRPAAAQLHVPRRLPRRRLWLDGRRRPRP